MIRKSWGELVLTPGENLLHVQVDTGIVDLTRALIPSVYRKNLNQTRYPPHITVVRNELWFPDNSLDGRTVEFNYDPSVIRGHVYWWLRVWSEDLIQLRKSYFLPDMSRYTKPPDLEDCFHITVGNTKRSGYSEIMAFYSVSIDDVPHYWFEAESNEEAIERADAVGLVGKVLVVRLAEEILQQDFEKGKEEDGWFVRVSAPHPSEYPGMELLPE